MERIVTNTYEVKDAKQPLKLEVMLADQTNENVKNGLDNSEF